MADDNILAGIGGFLEGVRDVYVPFAQEQARERRKRIPLSRVRALSGIDIPDIEGDQFVTPDELGLIKQQELLKRQGYFLDPEGNLINVPYGTKQLKTFETPEEKLESGKELEKFKADIGIQKKKEFEEIETEASKPKIEKVMQNVLDEYDKAIALAKKIKQRVSAKTFFLQKLPFTESRSIASDLDTLKTKIGFNALGKLREQSPTGGALGQVSEKEGAWLQSSEVPLSLDLPIEDLRSNISNLISGYEKSKSNLLDGYKKQFKTEYAPENTLDLKSASDEEIERRLYGK